MTCQRSPRLEHLHPGPDSRLRACKLHCIMLTTDCIFLCVLLIPVTGVFMLNVFVLIVHQKKIVRLLLLYILVVLEMIVVRHTHTHIHIYIYENYEGHGLD